MTQTNPEVPVVPMQADREAAADLIAAYFPNRPEMQELAQRYRDGHNQGVWAHAFASHRLAHQTPPATQPGATVEAMSRVIFPEWWKWFDVHGDVTLSDDGVQLKSRLDVAERALAFASTLHTPPPVATATVESMAKALRGIVAHEASGHLWNVTLSGAEAMREGGQALAAYDAATPTPPAGDQ